jgi:hypothetical protein
VEPQIWRVEIQRFYKWTYLESLDFGCGTQLGIVSQSGNLSDETQANGIADIRANVYLGF